MSASVSATVWFGSVVLVEGTTGKVHRTREIGDTRREPLFVAMPE